MSLSHQAIATYLLDEVSVPEDVADEVFAHAETCPDCKAWLTDGTQTPTFTDLVLEPPADPT